MSQLFADGGVRRCEVMGRRHSLLIMLLVVAFAASASLANPAPADSVGGKNVVAELVLPRLSNGQPGTSNEPTVKIFS